MFELKAQMYFAAAHHLLNYEGECENQHGHNWLVEAYVKGESLDKSNILVDYKVLKRELKAVLDMLDHKDLNELPFFKGESPSSEMISMFIYNQLKEKIESMGGKVTGSVTGKTFALINNDAASNSSKNKKARELGVEIMTEREFLERYDNG